MIGHFGRFLVDCLNLSIEWVGEESLRLRLYRFHILFSCVSTLYLCAKCLSSSSYYILSLLSISAVDAIETVNAISRGEDIPTTIVGVDDTSDDRVRALARITSASYLIVWGG